MRFLVNHIHDKKYLNYPPNFFQISFKKIGEKNRKKLGKIFGKKMLEKKIENNQKKFGEKKIEKRMLTFLGNVICPPYYRFCPRGPNYRLIALLLTNQNRVILSGM